MGVDIPECVQAAFRYSGGDPTAYALYPSARMQATQWLGETSQSSGTT
jgi:hypothetical protein